MALRVTALAWPGQAERIEPRRKGEEAGNVYPPWAGTAGNVLQQLRNPPGKVGYGSPADKNKCKGIRFLDKITAPIGEEAGKATCWRGVAVAPAPPSRMGRFRPRCQEAERLGFLTGASYYTSRKGFSDWLFPEKRRD